MSVKIEACCSMHESDGGSRALASRCAQSCMSDAGGEHVELVIYAGTYRDDNVVEPAQAPYAQRDLGAVAGVSDEHPRGAFSFDVDNLLAGIEIADGMIRSNQAQRALVVAVDRGVGHDEAPGAPVGGLAGALLLSRGDGARFVAFHSDLFPEHKHLREGVLRWTTQGGAAAHRMQIQQDKRYLEACISSTRIALRNFFGELGLSPRQIPLVIASQSPRGLPGALGECFGWSAEQVVQVQGADRELHTAGPVAALDVAWRDGRLGRAERVLFVTVSSGITVSAALYEKPACPMQ